MQIIRWQKSDFPQEKELRAQLRQEGLAPYTWSNAPGDYYAAHTHSYEKILYCLRGSIRFVLHGQEEAGLEDNCVDLEPGDCMILPAGFRHSAQVGPRGVTCMEAARYPDINVVQRLALDTSAYSSLPFDSEG